MFWLFGIRQEVKNLKKEVKQIKCKHQQEKNIFVDGRVWVFGMMAGGWYRKCSLCGAVLESFSSSIDMSIAQGKWHKKEAARLDVYNLPGTEYLHKKMGEKAPAGAVCALNNVSKDRIIAEGDYIQKKKGRWVHVKSGVVLKVKK